MLTHITVRFEKTTFVQRLKLNETDFIQTKLKSLFMTFHSPRHLKCNTPEFTTLLYNLYIRSRKLQC